MPRDRCSPTYINRIIPELEQIMDRLRSLEAEVQEKEALLRQARIAARRRGETFTDTTFLQEEAEIDFLRILVSGQFERIRDLGGEVKGGYLVDFPYRIGGEDVLLCWKPGETSVTWYHGLYEGMLGRKPIPPEILNGDEIPPGAGAEPE